MSRLSCVLIGLIVCVALFGQARAEGNKPVETDTSVWHVISASGAQRLSDALPLERDLEGGWRIATVNIEKDRVRICLEEPSTDGAPRRQCGVLFHPEQAFPGAEPVGSVASLLVKAQDGPSPAWATIREAVLTLASGLWQQVRRENPDPIGSNHGFSRALWHLLAENETQLAARLLESLTLQDVPARTSTLFEALILGQQGERAKADELLARLPEWEEMQDPHVTLVRGRVAMLNEEAEAGAGLFAQALANLPLNSESRCVPPNDVPRLLARMGRQAQALAAWEALLAHFPDCKGIWTGFSAQLLDWGLTDQALALIDRALVLMPEDTDFLFQKVAIFRRQKKTLEAIALLDRINTLNPNQEAVINLHSTLASSLPSAEEYRAVLLARAQADPGDLFAVHSAGVMSHYAGDYATSVRLMDQAKEALPNNSRAHIYAAMSRYQLGQWEEAKAGLDLLSRLNASDPDLHYCYAMVWSTRDTEIARRHLEQYLAVPHLPDAIPAKQDRAWREWEMLAAGQAPPDWLPGAQVSAAKRRGQRGSGDETNQMVLALTAAVGLLAGGLLGVGIGRRRR